MSVVRFNQGCIFILLIRKDLLIKRHLPLVLGLFSKPQWASKHIRYSFAYMGDAYLEFGVFSVMCCHYQSINQWIWLYLDVFGH